MVSPYIVPSLVDLDFGVTARWLTDVVALHPACVWSKTNVSGGILDYRPSNLSTIPYNQTTTIFLADVGVDVTVGGPSSSSYISCSPGIPILFIQTSQRPFRAHPSVCWIRFICCQTTPIKDALARAALYGNVLGRLKSNTSLCN